MLHLSNAQRILVLTIMFLFLAWFFESFFLTRRSGNMRRGFKIWSKPLSSKAQDYLSHLTKYVIETRRVRLATTYSFVIVEDKEAIICPYYRSIFPCVGFANLGEPNAQLEYRGGVSHFLVFLLALVYPHYLVIPVFALVLILNYWLSIWMVDSYLDKKIRARDAVG